MIHTVVDVFEQLAGHARLAGSVRVVANGRHMPGTVSRWVSAVLAPKVVGGLGSITVVIDGLCLVDMEERSEALAELVAVRRMPVDHPDRERAFAVAWERAQSAVGAKP